MADIRYDVLGIGNAIVDVIARAEDDFLVQQKMQKGGMALIDEPRAQGIYDAMGPAVEVSGGSAANTIVGVAGFGARAAFEHGDEWLAATLGILDRNRRLVTDLLAEHLPRARYVVPQASYLAWIDCSDLGLGPDPAKLFLERGRVALSSGPIFGTGGEGYARLNFATTRTLLEEAVRRMAKALT